MAKTVFLHIGRHKTGTSSLQQYLAQNVPLLRDRAGLIYPETGRRTAAGGLGTAHHDLSYTLRFGNKDALLDLRAELERETGPDADMLISSEDLQNVRHFDALRTVFDGWEVHVIAYMREYLAYLLSAFAQRVHYSSEVSNIRTYLKHTRIDLRDFVRDWTEYADRVDFRLYERAQLVGEDIVEDFFSTIGHPELAGGEVVVESNPSLSGNLLGLKMLLNLIGQSDLLSYEQLAEATEADPSFSGKIFVSNEMSAELRSQYSYNAQLQGYFPDATEGSFESGSKLFDLERWDADMDKIAAHLGLDALRLFQLGAIGRFLDKTGLAATVDRPEFTDQVAQFDEKTAGRLLEARLIEATRKSKETAIRAEGAAYAKDKLLRKAQVNQDRLSERLSKLGEKLEDQRTRNAELGETNDKLRADNAKLLASVAKVRQDKDVLMQAADKVRADKEEMMASIAKLREGNETLIDTVNKVNDDKKELADSNAKLREGNETLMRTVTKLREGNQRLMDQIASRQDKTNEQIAQVHFFRGEFQCLNGNVEAARVCYAKAAELDPDNETYAERVAAPDHELLPPKTRLQRLFGR
ncbi:MAG: hypothetical protein WBF53_15505 [Litorimonas sp.]